MIFLIGESSECIFVFTVTNRLEESNSLRELISDRKRFCLLLNKSF